MIQQPGNDHDADEQIDRDYHLLGPIVINAANHLAQQVVLTEKKWTTRQPLIRLQPEIPLAKSA